MCDVCWQQVAVHNMVHSDALGKGYYKSCRCTAVLAQSRRQ